ncbi:hypothetical protein PAMC26577_23750 [Caballeronia sordidicola]|uniref:Uncharacterized protein n=1 Tax=Caballeronia sordidicola TaxID=196367 RepID=A0A242MJI8_CABSO|nr:hypothetical protein PAMC26577_23750 [Caballeronia sordidicola]
MASIAGSREIRTTAAASAASDREDGERHRPTLKKQAR